MPCLRFSGRVPYVACFLGVATVVSSQHHVALSEQPGRASSCALTWHLGLLFAADAPCAESFFCSSDFLWDQLLKGEFLALRVQANSAYF